MKSKTEALRVCALVLSISRSWRAATQLLRVPLSHGVRRGLLFVRMCELQAWECIFLSVSVSKGSSPCHQLQRPSGKTLYAPVQHMSKVLNDQHMFVQHRKFLRLLCIPVCVLARASVFLCLQDGEVTLCTCLAHAHVQGAGTWAHLHRL